MYSCKYSPSSQYVAELMIYTSHLFLHSFIRSSLRLIRTNRIPFIYFRGEYQRTEVAIKQVKMQDLTVENMEAVKREAEIM